MATVKLESARRGNFKRSKRVELEVPGSVGGSVLAVMKLLDAAHRRESRGFASRENSIYTVLLTLETNLKCTLRNHVIYVSR